MNKVFGVGKWSEHRSQLRKKKEVARRPESLQGVYGKYQDYCKKFGISFLTMENFRAKHSDERNSPIDRWRVILNLNLKPGMICILKRGDALNLAGVSFTIQSIDPLGIIRFEICDDENIDNHQFDPQQIDSFSLSRLNRD